jgi:acyl-CoA synthetase (AMP-forming)/AMP-acid ligase II
VPDELRGEEVFAFVVVRERSAADPAALVEHCLERLAYFKAPAFVAFVDGLPLTASQKINRAEMKARARSCLGTSACVDLRQAKQRRRPRAG